MSTNKEALSVAQRIVAVDTQYNSARPLPSQQYKLLYIRRRNQLLQENARSHDNSTIRKQYLQMRSQILASRYGPIDRRSFGKNGSKKGSSLRQSMESLPRVSGDSSFLTTPPRHSTPLLRSGVVPTRVAEASRAMAGDNSLQEHYAFCGMQHIFDRHRDSITAIRFAHDDRTRLTCASHDGTLSVFTLVSEPPSLVCSLEGHEKGVNDFDWSFSNDFIVSASSDSTYRLWDAVSGQCLRVIVDTNGAQSNCCRFHTQNGNFLITGNSKGQLRVYNVSTGKIIKGGTSKTAGAVLSLTLEPSGGVVWATDSKGSMFSFLMDTTSGRLRRLKRIIVSPGVPITSVSCRTWASREARDPTLLLSCGDNTLRLYRIMSNGEVYLKRQMYIPHSTEPVHSAFCPLMSFLQGACVVSGGEDGRVYLYDIETGAQVNTLQGHSCPVLDVSWNYDESLLASCDAEGTIIIWKRCDEQTTADNNNS